MRTHRGQRQSPVMTTANYGCFSSCLFVLLIVTTNAFTTNQDWKQDILPWTSSTSPSTLSLTRGKSTTSRGWTTSTSSTTKLNMVFDFFKKRSEEGIEQLSKLGDAAREGKLVQGLAEAAAYTRLTNDAFANGLAKSRSRFLNNLEGFFTGRTDGDMDGILDDLLDVLLQADLGMATSEDIIEEIKLLKDDSEKFLSRDDLLSIMRGKLIETLDTGAKDGSNGRAIRFEGSEIEDQVDTPLSTTTDGETKKIPTVLFIIGANGQGKTTSIGKLAHRLKNEGNQTVLMAACDTYRAGAVEQLQQWADRAEVDLVSPSESVTSPSAVVYSALDKALNEGYDTVLIDTSGRLSNNAPLTQELVKMKRVIQKRLSIEKDPETNKPIPNTNVPHECLLVLDAAQGRMALDSARIWNKEVGLTGLILTKLDGSARGGSVVAISRDLNLPVKLIGVGEGIEDLRDFEPEVFVDGLLGIGAAGGKSSASEGKMLAARLETLRKERASRTSATLSQQQPMTVGAGLEQQMTMNSPMFSGAPSPRTSARTGGGEGGSKRKQRRKQGKR